MFGDHQPSVEQEFLDKAYGVTQDEMTMAQYMDKFKVPFIIWANDPLTSDSTKVTSLFLLVCAAHWKPPTRQISVESAENHSGDDLCFR